MRWGHAPKGRLPRRAESMLLFDLLGGALWMRLVLRRDEPHPDFAAAVVDAVLTGIS